MKNYTYLVLGLCSLLAIELNAQTDSTNCPKDTINGEIVYRYEVEKSIGLYRIGVKFGVPQSEIVRMNPELKERGLRFGETLIIPTGQKAVKPKKEVKVVEENVVTNMLTADIVTTDIMTTDNATSDNAVAPEKRLMELAVMLPFESGQAKQSQNAERIMAFYQGVLLAMNDSQNDSTKYRLRVYDTGRSGSHLHMEHRARRGRYA